MNELQKGAESYANLINNPIVGIGINQAKD